MFTDTEIKDMAGYCDMVCAMADYNRGGRTGAAVRGGNMPAAERAFLRCLADCAALAQTLRGEDGRREKRSPARTR